jgi:hypothetical protein
MRKDAQQLMRRGELIAGIIVVPESMAIGRAINELELMIACYSQEEFRDGKEYLPL